MLFLAVGFAGGIALVALFAQSPTTAAGLKAVGDRVSIFATVFLGIFIEAAPFLLLGSLASGVAEAFVDRDWLARRIPRSPLAAALLGGCLGMLVPVCECGVVPLARRLFRKGLPASVGISFLLAAPVLNPITLFSTAAAFGFGRTLALRMAISLFIAVSVGLVFSLEPDPMALFSPATLPAISGASQMPTNPRLPLAARWSLIARIARDDFFEMGQYLVFGTTLAAFLQVLVPQSTLLPLGAHPLYSVLALMTLAVLLSVCSTVDSFLALGFVNTFSGGALIAFLVFGPMVDIKSTLMYLQVFRRRVVVYLILLPFLMSLLAGLYLNLAGFQV
jgi:uncharacterized membrane protein YraQ (UPF0718 family)